MRIRKAIIAVIAAVLVAGGATWWFTRPSYDDIVKGCGQALESQRKAHGSGRPAKCDGVEKDDYDELVAAVALKGLGWTDKDGNFDENKMLNDILNDQP